MHLLFISSVFSNRSKVFDDPQFFYGLQVNSVHMNFDDPEEFDDPHVFDDPQGIKLEVRTLIIQKFTVIPPSSMVLLGLFKISNSFGVQL